MSKPITIGNFKISNKKLTAFKSKQGFIRELWVQNRDYILEKSPKMTPKKLFRRFKDALENLSGEDSTNKNEWRQAARAVSRNREFMDAQEIALENAKKRMTKELSKNLRYLSSGGYKKGYWNTFEKDWKWNEHDQVYENQLHPGYTLRFSSFDEYKITRDVLVLEEPFDSEFMVPGVVII